jgi:hypothetical protein
MPAIAAFRIVQVLAPVVSPLVISPVPEDPSKFVIQIDKRKIAAAPNYGRLSPAGSYTLIFIY